ncbi:hypothetical protein D3C76_1659150 [compost metagenome]
MKPELEHYLKDVTIGRVYEVYQRPTRKVFIDDAGEDNYGAYSPQGIYTFEDVVDEVQTIGEEAA